MTRPQEQRYVPYILEGILTSMNEDGSTNIAPMGPVVSHVDQRVPRELILRPYIDSTTCQNLLRHPEAVFHVTDDSLLFARAVTRRLHETPIALLPAIVIQGRRLADTCRWHEVRIREIDDSQSRLEMRAEVVYTGRQAEWRGFNRAGAAVIEAAILATRLHILSADEIASQMQQLGGIVEKTAGEHERMAFDMLHTFIRDSRETMPPSPSVEIGGKRDG